ncbi:hypothetical protein Tco_0665649 [Tanacetum coccineum]
MFVEFVIQNQLFSYSLEDFAQILNIPCKGVCVFTDRWRLDELAYGIPSDGPYHTNPPSIDDIISSIRIDREGQVRRIRHEEEIDVLEYQILTQRKTRKDRGTRRGRHSTSSSTFDQPSSSHLNDDDDENDEGTSRASTPSPIRYVNSLTNEKIKLTIIPPRQLFVNISSDEDVTTTPSPTTTSSSPTPPNAPSKTPSNNDTSTSHDDTPSSFQSKLQISPPSSNEPTSPQPLNPLLNNISDVPPRPSNPQPLQSHPSLDITLSLSPFENLEPPSPPSPPQPQPPIMGHPLFYNYHDYHGSTCICCSHNRNLFLTLRDEMNIMFAHLEYLLTTAITSHFPPPP